MDKRTTSNSRGQQRRAPNSDRFLEALRDLGSNVVDSAAHDAVGGLAKSPSEFKPNQPLDLAELRKQEEKREKKFFGFQQDYLNLRHQEKLIWTKQEQETKLQINAVLGELKKLAQATKNLAQEVKIASEQVPVEPGVYHLSFFEKLRQTILLFKKQIEQSASWLTTSNQRAKKRNFYWSQVRKSGTKFMLSQERYMSTQAG